MPFWSRKPKPSAARGVHVVPDGGYWKIVIAHQYETQDAAEGAGRLVSKVLKAEFHLHGTDGRIRKKDSHGSDPPEIPG